MGKKKSSSLLDDDDDDSRRSLSPPPQEQQQRGRGPTPQCPGTPPTPVPSTNNERVKLTAKFHKFHRKCFSADQSSPNNSKELLPQFPRNRSRSPTDRSQSPTPSHRSVSPSLSVHSDMSELLTTTDAAAAAGPVALLREWATDGGFPAAFQPQQQQSPINNAMRIKRRTSNSLKAKKQAMDDSKIGARISSSSHQDTSMALMPSGVRRSFSWGTTGATHTAKSDVGDFRNKSLSSLFHVTFAPGSELANIREFERVDADQKNDLWYFAKELRSLVAEEVDRNRRYEEGEISVFELAELREAGKISSASREASDDPEEICCWRGLEHVLEGDDRSVRIRKVVSGIVGWYRDAKEMGYTDPDELRVVSKSRTKSDRSKAQKRGAQDASYMKKLAKGSADSNHRSSSEGGGMSPKRIVKRISGKISSLPKLNWSPKPSKKIVSA